jgi:hypothetical protein
MTRKLFHLAFVCLAGMSLSSAQVPTGNNRPVVDVDERVLWEKYHIPLTKEGLLGALGHERSDVRSFAALKLAAGGQNDAITPILVALRTETVAGAAISMATAASQLDSDEGIQALKAMCENPNWQPSLRMLAAQSMMNLDGQTAKYEGCLNGVVGVRPCHHTFPADCVDNPVIILRSVDFPEPDGPRTARISSG